MEAQREEGQVSGNAAHVAPKAITVSFRFPQQKCIEPQKLFYPPDEKSHRGESSNVFALQCTHKNMKKAKLQGSLNLMLQ